jgi:hypothetical protein
MGTSNHAIDYKTHILIGVCPTGEMEVIGDWSYVPTQAEVQRKIDVTCVPFVRFALCTPTSIMPGKYGTTIAPKRTPSRFGSPLPVRRR